MVLNEKTVSSMETVSLVLSYTTSCSTGSDGFPAVRCYRWMDPITGYMECVYILFRISEVFVNKDKDAGSCPTITCGRETSLLVCL